MTKPRTPTEHDRWSLAEAVDLPLALEEERYAPNRHIELERARDDIAPGIDPAAPEDQRDLLALRAWLRRWQGKTAGNTPGEWIEDVLRNAGRLALAAGILLGLAAASDRLFFTGPEPLNVFFLIGIFVLLPMLLSGTLLLTVSLRRPGQGNLLQQFFLLLARKLTRTGRAWDASAGLRAEPSWTAITKSLGKNRELLQAPVLAITQKLALGFGAGLLIMLQLRVSFWELAFGWQTTLTAPGDVWHLFTQALAAPWSWFWPEGSPSLEQINATRYSRLPGSPPIDPAASRAWWPFLFATILVWSVLFRAVILAGLRVFEARRLRAFDPRTPDAQLLIRRLRPHWSGPGSDSEPGSPASPSPSPARQLAQRDSWLALIADESDAAMPKSHDLPALVGVAPAGVASFEFDDSLGRKTAAALDLVRGASGPVLVLLPAARDPIDEVSDTLRAIVSSADGRGVTLLLRGSPERLAVWKRKLDAWDLGVAAEYLPAP